MAFGYKDFEKLTNSFKDMQAQYNEFIEKFLTEMGMRLLAQTKKLTPVDTGELRNSWELNGITRSGDYLEITLLNSAEYASFVEDGHMQRRRFLPIEYLEQSKSNSAYLNYLFDAYGDDVSGIMLQDKWIPGYHMARISINNLEKEIPKRYEKALKQFIKGLEA